VHHLAGVPQFAGVGVEQEPVEAQSHMRREFYRPKLDEA
jgi:hypothetical protein